MELCLWPLDLYILGKQSVAASFTLPKEIAESMSCVSLDSLS